MKQIVRLLTTDTNEEFFKIAVDSKITSQVPKSQTIIIDHYHKPIESVNVKGKEKQKTVVNYFWNGSLESDGNIIKVNDYQKLDENDPILVKVFIRKIETPNESKPIRYFIDWYLSTPSNQSVYKQILKNKIKREYLQQKTIQQVPVVDIYKTLIY